MKLESDCGRSSAQAKGRVMIGETFGFSQYSLLMPGSAVLGEANGFSLFSTIPTAASDRKLATSSPLLVLLNDAPDSY
jgi:hypothetical protein